MLPTLPITSLDTRHRDTFDNFAALLSEVILIFPFIPHFMSTTVQPDKDNKDEYEGNPQHAGNGEEGWGETASTSCYSAPVMLNFLTIKISDNVWSTFPSLFTSISPTILFLLSLCPTTLSLIYSLQARMLLASTSEVYGDPEVSKISPSIHFISIFNSNSLLPY